MWPVDFRPEWSYCFFNSKKEGRVSKVGKSCLIVSCLLVVFLLWLPAPASAAGKGIGFSLRVHGGFSYLGAADVNTGSKGWFDYLDLLASPLGLTTSGTYGDLHGGYDFGADFIIQLTSRIGVGVGAGYLQSSRTSSMGVTGSGVDATLKETPKLSAIPIRLGVFVTWPMGGKLNLTANAGAAYYAAVKFNGLMRLDDHIVGDWQQQLVTAKSNRLGNIGFQGGLGLEYELAQRMFIFVEAQGRYARFKNFDTATALTDSSLGTGAEDVGKIYLETNTSTSPAGSYTMFLVSDTTPTPEPGVTEYREPKFDFSGLCLQLGFRVRF